MSNPYFIIYLMNLNFYIMKYICFNYFQIQIITKNKYVKFKNEYILLIFSFFFFLLFYILYFIEINYIYQINVI